LGKRLRRSKTIGCGCDGENALCDIKGLLLSSDNVPIVKLGSPTIAIDKLATYNGCRIQRIIGSMTRVTHISPTTTKATAGPAWSSGVFGYAGDEYPLGILRPISAVVCMLSSVGWTLGIKGDGQLLYSQ
jgi:hypothetical protein